MRVVALLCGACLAIGFSWPLSTQAETVLEMMRKDPRYQALTPEQQKQELDRLNDIFRLFTNCQPLAVTVDVGIKDSNAFGLTKADIQNAAESRLRGAYIYTAKFSFPSLGISIVTYQSAFSVTLQLRKILADTHSPWYGGAVTWSDGHVGTFSRDSFILSSLSKLLDRFIADYLRVNEEACVSKRGAQTH